MTLMETKDEMFHSQLLPWDFDWLPNKLLLTGITCRQSVFLSACLDLRRIFIPAQWTVLIVLGELRSLYNCLITFHFCGNSPSFISSFICGLLSCTFNRHKEAFFFSFFLCLCSPQNIQAWCKNQSQAFLRLKVETSESPLSKWEQQTWRWHIIYSY